MSEEITDAHIDKVKIVRNEDDSINFLIHHQSGFIETYTTIIKDNKVFLQRGGIYTPYNPFEEVNNV